MVASFAGRADFAFLDHPGPLAFAHRGGMAHGLENSMTAFQRAVDLGYRYLETDLQATADGVLLAFHDRTLGRVTDRSGRIARMPYREVAKARIGGVEPIPLLEDILGTWPHVRVNVDVKDFPAIRPLARVLRRTGAWDRVCISSFSGRRLAQVRAALAEVNGGHRVCTALDPIGVLGLKLASYGGALARLARAGVPCVQVPVSAGPLPFVTAAFVDTAHELGMQVHAWTVNDPARMHQLLDLGVDGIMTDDLEVLRDVLRARGAWHPRSIVDGDWEAEASGTEGR